MKKLLLVAFPMLLGLLSCTKDDSAPLKPDNPTTEEPIPHKSPLYGIKLTNVDSRAMFSKEGLQKVVDDCVETGLNTIFICVWNDTYTLYPSPYMKQMFGEEVHPSFVGRDALAELLELAKPKGIKVIAWMEYGFAAKWGDPVNGGRLLIQRPDWASRDIDGNITSENGFQWMDPFNPEVQQFMTSLISEVVTKYAVDGVICCDRLPALPVKGGYNAYIKEMYTRETGLTVPSNPKDPQWIQWRADKLTRYQGELYNRIKLLRKDCIVAFSPSPYMWSKENYLQDWEKWVRNKKVDYILPQLYRFNVNDYLFEVDKNFTKNTFLDSLKDKSVQFAPAIVLNAGSQFISETDLRTELSYNRSRGILGEAFFFYGALEKRPAYKEVLKEFYKK